MERWSKSHPYRISVLIALLMTAVIIVGNIVSNVMSLDSYIDGAGDSLALGITNLINILIAVVIMHKSEYSFGRYGFRSIEKGSLASVWFLIPVVLELLLPIILAGFSSEMSIAFILITAFFTITVGFTEEMFFRGLILKYLEVKSVKTAVLVSSIIFGVVHMANALNGNSITSVILQIFYAFLFGVVCAEMVYLTKSIWIPIIWHTLHDFISYVTPESFTMGSLSEQISVLLLEGTEFLVLLVFAIGMAKKLNKGRTGA